MRDNADGIHDPVVVNGHDVAAHPVVIVGLTLLCPEHVLHERGQRRDRRQWVGHRVMGYRRTQFRRDAVTAERRHYDRSQGAGHDRQEHAPAPRCPQRAAKDDDRQHGSQRELQPDRLMDQCQSRNDQAVCGAAHQAAPPRSRERERHGEQRQRRRAEQVGAGRVGRERDSEGQQRNQHRDHQPALGATRTEQHHTRDQGQGAEIAHCRQPAQSERGREVMSGDKPDQLTGQPPTDEPERVVDGVVGDPVHVKRHDVDRDEQHGRGPRRDHDGAADIKQRAGALPAEPAIQQLNCRDVQVRHRIRPNGHW